MTCTCTRTCAPRPARTDSDITGPTTPHGSRTLPEPRTLLFPDPSDFRPHLDLLVFTGLVPKASSSKSKDLRKDLPPASVPRVRNKLPQSFFDALKEKRQAGSPHRFTNSDVRAIVDFVSTPPERVHRPVLTEERLRQDREALDKAYEQFRREKADLERERAALPSKPPLLERLSDAASANARRAAATLSAPKPILIDFNKKTNEDLAKLLGPRFEAVQRRLLPLFNCEKRYKLAPDLKQGLERVAHLVDDLYQALELRLESWSLQDKKVLERCFLLLKGRSFTPLRPKYEEHVRFVVEEFGTPLFTIKH
ncbi:hypothetical protein BDW22DRAFT_1347257 [Trametopsis cervina]|nr:hypothetical protein BDW22DRAFT_1347257 [Trametopsis cervina]